MANNVQNPPKPGGGPESPASQAPAGQGSPPGGRPALTSHPPAVQPPKRVGKFRLKAGDHVDDQLNWLPRSRVLEYAKEAGIQGAEDMPDHALRAAVRATQVAERRWRPGAVVASPRPLASRWPEKWERVSDDVPESPGEPTLRKQETEIEDSYTEAAAQQTWEAEHGSDDLHRLSLNQLRELAYQEGIDLGPADGKAAVLATIRRVRKALAEDR